MKIFTARASNSSLLQCSVWENRLNYLPVLWSPVCQLYGGYGSTFYLLIAVMIKNVSNSSNWISKCNPILLEERRWIKEKEIDKNKENYSEAPLYNIWKNIMSEHDYNIPDEETEIKKMKKKILFTPLSCNCEAVHWRTVAARHSGHFNCHPQVKTAFLFTLDWIQRSNGLSNTFIPWLFKFDWAVKVAFASTF